MASLVTQVTWLAWLPSYPGWPSCPAKQAKQPHMASLENQLSKTAFYALVRGQPGYIGDKACLVTQPKNKKNDMGHEISRLQIVQYLKSFESGLVVQLTRSAWLPSWWSDQGSLVIQLVEPPGRPGYLAGGATNKTIFMPLQAYQL